MTDQHTSQSNGPETKEPTIIHGTPLTGGIAIGKVFRPKSGPPQIRESIDVDIEGEKLRFETAKLAASRIVRDLIAQAEEGSDPQKILQFQQSLLNGSDLDRIAKIIENRSLNAEAATRNFLLDFRTRIAATGLRDKIQDLLDLEQLILGELDPNIKNNSTAKIIANLDEPRIIVVDDFEPLILMRPECRRKIKGIISLRDGPSGHTKIAASAFRIPLISSINPNELIDDDFVLISNSSGQVIVNPTPEMIQDAESEALTREHSRRQATLQDNPSVTVDGIEVQLFANIVDPSQWREVVTSGCKGVGLFRTEMTILRDGNFIGLDQQCREYIDLIKNLAPDPVTIRVFDYGREDKSLEGFRPENGEHGLELALNALREELKTQLSAIVRASLLAGAGVKILLPTVSSVNQVVRVRQMINDARQVESARLNSRRAPKIELGAMIENPAALLAIKELAKIVDFFSVGTNDLCRTMLDMERTQAGYRPTHPAMVSALRIIASAAKRSNKPVTICGTVAEDPIMIPMLLGCGFTRFSASPSMLAEINHIVRISSVGECKRAVEKMINQSNTALKNQVLLTDLHTKMEARETPSSD